jgi:hypothetical protein
MRLWSIHPKYLDTKGILALWREGLLAKKVLEGKTRGYIHHPQLVRFKNFQDPILAIESYLYYVYLKAIARGHSFDRAKIKIEDPLSGIIPVTSGQVRFEFIHLCNKLKKRDLERYKFLCDKDIEVPDVNPVFYLVDGEIESWERIQRNYENY